MEKINNLQFVGIWIMILSIIIMVSAMLVKDSINLFITTSLGLFGVLIGLTIFRINDECMV